MKKNSWIQFLKMWKTDLKYNFKQGTPPATIYNALKRRDELRGLLAGTHAVNGKPLK